MALPAVRSPPASRSISYLGWGKAGDPQGVWKGISSAAQLLPHWKSCPVWVMRRQGKKLSGDLYPLSKTEIGGGDAPLWESPNWALVFLPTRKDPTDGWSPGPAYRNGGRVA